MVPDRQTDSGEGVQSHPALKTESKAACKMGSLRARYSLKAAAFVVVCFETGSHCSFNWSEIHNINQTVLKAHRSAHPCLQSAG